MQEERSRYDFYLDRETACLPTGAETYETAMKSGR
jgi:hypothetical protein